MAVENKRKQFHYRKAVFMKPSSKTLQELLEEALEKLTPVSNRFEDLSDGMDSPDDAWKRFVNTHRSAYGLQCGNMVLYAADQNHQVITMDDNKDELDIEAIAPPAKDDGRRREFLESILFYGIKDNHIILIQSMSLRARELELHINWLLKEAKVLAEDNIIFLDNYVPQVTQEKIQNANVKSVKVGTPLYSHIEPIIEKSGTKSTRYKASGEGIDILKLLSPSHMSNISWEDIESKPNLEVFIEITYKRQTDNSSQKILNQISTALRNSSDDDIRIELKDGGTIVGSELKIKAYKTISSYNGLLDPNDVFSQMNYWLIDILTNGLIDAD